MTQQLMMMNGTAYAPRERGRPPLIREALFGLDYLGLRLSDVYNGEGVAHGDGAPVVIVPGMFASDLSLRTMHRWLGRIGYDARFSNIGRNRRCPDASLEDLTRTVDDAFAESGRQVHVIGHSLGGLLARGAAMQRPDRVAQVMTLGSPVSGVKAHPAVLAATGMLVDCDGTCLPRLQRALPPSVSEVNIFSRSDAVVDWRSCRSESGRCVEVDSTHCGMAFNADTYRAIATALAAHQRTDEPARPVSRRHHAAARRCGPALRAHRR